MPSDVDSNPLRPVLDALWARLNALNGMLFLLEGHLNKFRSMFKEGLAAHSVPLESIWGGASLAIRDLTEWPADGWAVYYASGGFHAKGESYLDLVDIFVERESAWTIAQGYETFETCLFDLFAEYLHIKPSSADPTKIRRLRPKLANRGLAASDVEFWRAFVRETRRNAFRVLDAVRLVAPLSDLEGANNRGLDLRIWHTVVAEVRHAATHANMRVTPRRTAAWSPGHFTLLETSFGGVADLPGMILHPRRKHAEHALVLFAEYGLGVFKALSGVCGYSATIQASQSDSAPA